jgi:hypothetical protein
MARSLAPTPNRQIQDAVLTAGALALSLGATILVLVLYLRNLHSGTSADALFGAFSLYLPCVLVGPTIRIFGPRWAETSAAGVEGLVGAVLLVATATMVCLFAVSGVAASLLTPPASHATATVTIRLLAPAAGLQLLAAGLAAALAAAGQLGRATTAYAVAGPVSLVTFLSLRGSAGTGAVAVSMLVGSAALVAVMVTGVRFQPRLAPVRLQAGLWQGVVLANPALISSAAALPIASGIAARATVGGVALLGYGFDLVLVGTSLTAGSMAVASAAAAHRGADTDGLDGRLRHVISALVPLLAGCFLIGVPLVGVFLRLPESEIDRLRLIVVTLVPFAFAVALVGVSTNVLDAVVSPTRRASLLVVALLVTAVVAISLRSVLGEYAAGVALSTAHVVQATAVMLLLVRAGVSGRWAAASGRQVALAGVAALLAWGALRVTGTENSAPLAVGVGLVALAVYGLFSRPARSGRWRGRPTTPTELP